MEYRILGKSNLKVSRLCFGTLTMTKHQSDLEIDNATKLISLAYEKGINFFDTAEIYDNYHMLAPAVKQLGRENFIITSKTYAYSKEGAQESLNLYLMGVVIGGMLISLFQIIHIQMMVFYPQ